MNSKAFTFTVVGLVALSVRVCAADATLPTFKKQHLEKFYWSEGAMLGDLNKDLLGIEPAHPRRHRL